MGDNNNGEKKGISGIIVFFTLIGAMLLLFLLISPGMSSSPNNVADLSRVMAAVKAGEVEYIAVEGDRLKVRMTNGTEVISQKEPGVPLAQTLKNYGATDEQVSKIGVKVEQPSNWGNWLGNLIWVLPMFMLAGMLFFLMRQGQGTGGQAINFAKSRARQVNIDKPTVTFSDVAGVDEAKQELEEVVQFLKFPHKFRALGAHIPRGLLLVGPPGTGKTLLSRAVAGEAGVPFFSISGSEFVELFVGVGASRVRDLFDQAKKNAPCIIFIDEIDAVGRQRGTGLGGGHDEREQTLNQILVEMDGFDPRMNIVVIAATNRPDVLDPALLRPGRFDRRVMLDSPDIKGRLEILRVHSKGKPLEAGVDLETLAKQTPGFSGADLENLVNEAAILAARRGGLTIGMSELEEAIDRVIAGPARKSRIITAREKAITAYHEAGHALTAHLVPNADPVHKISIVARGISGGHTRLLPTEDRMLLTRSQMKDTLVFALGGQVAEEIIFGEMTTGAGSDLQQVTKVARSMVTEYGMSDKLGPVVFGHKEELSFLGRDLGEQRNYGEETANAIDAEVRRLVGEAEETARRILIDHKDKLAQIANLLMEKETLQGAELEQLLDLPRPVSTFGRAYLGAQGQWLGSRPANPEAESQDLAEPA